MDLKGKKGLSAVEVGVGCLILLAGGLFFFRALDAARLKRTQVFRRALAQHLAVNVAHLYRSGSGSFSTGDWKSNASFIQDIQVEGTGASRTILVRYTTDPENTREETLRWETSEPSPSFR